MMPVNQVVMVVSSDNVLVTQAISVLHERSLLAIKKAPRSNRGAFISLQKTKITLLFQEYHLVVLPALIFL